MSIIPWLNYPGRPIKKKFVKMPYVPPYKGSPYEYINLPNPGDLPQAVWENIMKDLDQRLVLRYSAETAATLESATDEFQEQPGAVGAGITVDPRKYLEKGVGVVFTNTFKDWIKSVVSWSDLDTIVEQRYIWKPLTRGGRSTGGLKPLLDEPTPDVFRGFDRAGYEDFYTNVKPDRKFDPGRTTDIENLANGIETWVSYGKSKGSRAFRWSQVQRYWLSSLEQLAVIGSKGPIDPTQFPEAAAFANEINATIALNTWVAGSSSPKGFRALAENPFYTGLKGATDWKGMEVVLSANGFNPQNDRVLFDYQVKESLAKEVDKKKYNAGKIDWYINNDPAGLVALMQSDPKIRKAVAKIFGDKVTEADIIALTPTGLADLLEKGRIEKARGFYKSKIILPGGQMDKLAGGEGYIFNPGTPLNVASAARAKHSEVQKKLDFYNKEYERRLIELHRQIARDAKLQSQLRSLVGADKFDTLMDWQTVLNFRESVFKTQDFLDSAFDDNSLFRTYVWLGRVARDLPDWMGDWKTKLQYLTPQFYVSGILTQIDEKVLGLASFAKDSPRGLFLRFRNGGWVPLLKKAVYQRAADYKVAFKVASLLDDLVDEGVTVNGVLIDANAKRDLLLMKPVGGISLGALKESANPTLSNSKFLKDLLSDDDYNKHLAFINGKFQELINKGYVGKPEDIEWLLDRVKGKMMADKYLYMGPLVGLGRFLDHAQNLFVDKTIGRLGIFKRYADWFKAGNPAFAKAWSASKLGKGFEALSKKLISLGGGGGKKFFSKLLGSKVLGPLVKVLGSLLGAVGGIVVGVVGWIGVKLISDLWSLLRGQPVEATKEAVAKIGKFILGAAACCISPFLVLIFVIFFFIAAVFGLINQVGQAVTIGAIFDRLDVVKVGSYNPSTHSIEYAVTVTNKSNRAQKIQFVRDEAAVYLEDCSQAPIKLTTTSGGSYGYLDFSGMTPGVQEAIDLASGETVVYEYEIKDIPSVTGNITYLNKALIEIVPLTGVGVSDTGVVRKEVDFGNGGCKGAGDLAAISSALENCLRIQRNMTTYLILDTSCVSNTPILNTINCSNAVAAYYSNANPTYYPNNLQCVAFANIAVGCYGGADYYVNGNGSDWFDNASTSVYDKYRAGSAPFAPPAGSLLIFKSSGGGHVAPVMESTTAGNRTTVIVTGSNMQRPEYSLLFDERGGLVDPNSFPGLTFYGFSVPK